MKIIVVHCLTFAIALCVSAQNLALYSAREHGALAMECLQVVDQDGSPIADAKIWGGLQTGGNRNDFIEISGATNTNGEYVIRGKCTNRIRCDVTKEGYYRSEFLLTNYGYSHEVKEGKWQPYGDKHTIVLKKRIGNGNLAIPDKRKQISSNGLVLISRDSTGASLMVLASTKMSGFTSQDARRAIRYSDLRWMCLLRTLPLLAPMQ